MVVVHKYPLGGIGYRPWRCHYSKDETYKHHQTKGVENDCLDDTMLVHIRISSRFDHVELQHLEKVGLGMFRSVDRGKTYVSIDSIHRRDQTDHEYYGEKLRWLSEPATSIFVEAHEYKARD